MVLFPRPVDKSQHRVEDLSRRISHMALWTQCIHGLDLHRFPSMGPWKTYIPLDFLAQLYSNGIPICVAGSGKSIIWFVVSFNHCL